MALMNRVVHFDYWFIAQSTGEPISSIHCNTKFRRSSLLSFGTEVSTIRFYTPQFNSSGFLPAMRCYSSPVNYEVYL